MPKVNNNELANHHLLPITFIYFIFIKIHDLAMLLFTGDAIYFSQIALITGIYLHEIIQID